jgi:hypothetical protein
MTANLCSPWKTLSLLSLASLALLAQDGPVTPANVNLVEFADPGQATKITGSYVQTGPRAWAERDAKGKVSFTFIEKQRDAKSVVLSDDSRGVAIRLDLGARKVFYREGAAGQEQELFVVVNSSAKINGHMTRFVTAGEGGSAIAATYRQTAGSSWEELGSDGKVQFKFQEVKRDDGSVYLEDRSRGVAIRLDVRAKKVMYRESGKKEEVLFDIILAAAAPR